LDDLGNVFIKKILIMIIMEFRFSLWWFGGAKITTKGASTCSSLGQGPPCDELIPKQYKAAGRISGSSLDQGPPGNQPNTSL
jgi:hypothetical protein